MPFLPERMACNWNAFATSTIRLVNDEGVSSTALRSCSKVFEVAQQCVRDGYDASVNSTNIEIAFQMVPTAYAIAAITIHFVSDTLMKTAYLSFTALLLGACANSPQPTANSVTTLVDAYKTCVMDRSLPMAPSPEDANNIAKEAAVQCDQRLTQINQALRKENEQATFPGSFANKYTDSLRQQTITAAAEEINRNRTKVASRNGQR